MITFNQTISSNEIVYQTKIHWISYVKPILFMVIGTSFLLAVFFVKSWTIVFYMLLGYIALKGLYSYWYLKKVKIELSERFLSLKTGIFASQVNDISLSKLEGIQVSQSLLGRFLNYGRLIISTGEVSQSYLVEKPMELRKYLLENTK